MVEHALMKTVGIVLGAGGLVGQAFQSGVLASLETDLGWDPRRADVIVGTSAGALSGTALRMDTEVLDLAQWTLGGVTEGQLLSEFHAVRQSLPPPRLRTVLRPWRTPSRGAVLAALRRTAEFRSLALLATIVPTGHVSMMDHVDFSRGALPGVWPDGLRICACRRSDGARVVFGIPGAPEATLTAAAAASCAIPGYLAPVVIDGIPYIDGGAWSPTNADVLIDDHLDLVLVVSPMSGTSRNWDWALRRWARRRLQREIDALEATGTQVVCFEPGVDTVSKMGLDPMARDRNPEVLRSAFFEAGRHLADPVIRRRLNAHIGPTAVAVEKG